MKVSWETQKIMLCHLLLLWKIVEISTYIPRSPRYLDPRIMGGPHRDLDHPAVMFHHLEESTEVEVEGSKLCSSVIAGA